eukprot:NODE_52_length_30984_cov_1.383358.p25 type:complete len:154 gc:universal NODE_52_length_30984_cov_1.383358:17601-18062(+)
MSTTCRRRLLQDFKKIQKEPVVGINATPDPNNILMWNAFIVGPEDTIFHQGIFKLRLEFDETYPQKAPKVSFVTKIYHPNVYDNGALCLDIIQTRWSPSYDVQSILTSVQSLLNDPNPNSPANAEAARLFQDNRPEYDRKVRECVENSWLQDE